MAIDPAVIDAIASAVAAAPENTALRLHLSGLLLDDGQVDRALTELHEVLSRAPDSSQAAVLAARGYDAKGERERADRFRRLAAALGELPTADSTAPRADTEDGAVAGDHLPLVGPAPDSADPKREPPLGDLADAGPGGGVSDLDRFLEEVLAEGDAARVTLDDVAGLEDVKRRLRLSFLEPIRNPQLRRQFRKSLRGGLLLYGPPGCGKTFLARAIAGELGVGFLSVGLHDVLDQWLGRSEQNLHSIFESARRRAPCVLFLDEVDALGMKRTNLTHSAGRNVVVQLLTELDSTQDDNEGVFVLAATNAPWDLDTALRRPGRLDRSLLVLPPDAPAREAILAANLADRPHGPLDLGRIAQATEGYSGADLRLVCEAATELAIEASVTAGAVQPITPDYLKRALDSVTPSTGPWLDLAKTVATFSNESGEYDDLLDYRRRRKRR